MSEGCCPHHRLLREAVELHTPLHAVAGVDDGVGVGGIEAGQAGGEQLVLELGEKGGRKAGRDSVGSASWRCSYAEWLCRFIKLLQDPPKNYECCF